MWAPLPTDPRAAARVPSEGPRVAQCSVSGYSDAPCVSWRRVAETVDDDTIQASHQEFADMIATYRETVTLTLDELRKRGLVELGRRSVRIVDAEALQAVAEE